MVAAALWSNEKSKRSSSPVETSDVYSCSDSNHLPVILKSARRLNIALLSNNVSSVPVSRVMRDVQFSHHEDSSEVSFDGTNSTHFFMLLVCINGRLSLNDLRI